MKTVVLITGAGKGLGRVIAEACLEKGFVVYGTYRTSGDSPIKGVNYYKLDITSDDECKKTILKVIKKEKIIHVLINCAGVTISGPTLNYTADDFLNLMDTNVGGAFRLMKYLSPYKPRLIINVTSLNSFLSLPNYGLYAASKFALDAIGTAIRYELNPSTKVVNVAPGALLNENPVAKMVHKPVREKFPLLNLIIPLTKMRTVANEVIKLIGKEKVPTRVYVGRDAKMISFMQKVLPERVIDRLFLFLWKKR
ncbi:MAG: 3-oxoacyl-ACP reductase [Candidatus Woesebacteria bacterium GW2011_GWE1_45_18]|uniref:3-oxoacyl-ACP reductase n=1 Tax=Candidatus Woesebacteria bacterium GW2011_GWE1_45_18 TaxID=1618598 RepID=A0A0G1M6S2_9BACT|nr:MAG: 3-oxoacyl-ACP reductase [Candidatus Woesebacteria bacterium GW2011_GWE1_45_18]HBP51568.1 hypothetical protein [Candidatus Shapirobacteria bacterium]